MNQKLIGEFIGCFHLLRRFNCHEAIDQMFLKLIKEDWSKESLETNKMLLVTFLRANYKWKSSLKYYDDLLEKGIKYLKDNKCDPNNLLIGIIK